MFSYAEWLVFLSLAIATTLSPGPAVLLAIRNGAQEGIRRSISGIFGNVSAMLTYALMATLGVALVFSAFPEFSFYMQIIGGAYLAYLGVSMLLKGDRKAAHRRDFEKPCTPGRQLFLEAYFVGLSNPKAILFYSALFPQFITPGEHVAMQSAVLSMTFAACSFLALCLYSWLSSCAARQLSSRMAWTILNRLSGIIFIGLGGGLIFNTRQ